MTEVIKPVDQIITTSKRLMNCIVFSVLKDNCGLEVYLFVSVIESRLWQQTRHDRVCSRVCSHLAAVP